MADQQGDVPRGRSMFDAEQRRKQFAFQNARSHSAPPRKKWYRRGPLRRMGSQHTMLYDKMVSRRLVGAIAMWHDLHSNLLQLSLDRHNDKDEGQRVTSSNSSTSPVECDDDSISQESSLSDEEWDHRHFEDSDESDEDLLSDDALDEIVESERQNFRSRFSISNPDLTHDQLRNMFPELSDHWR
uniref:Coiled-coil domain-containing protein n=1 Tax=Bursaphelenchus xylophilus TaxID=6326 RepID=A0A1I7RPR1_BURXY